MCKILDFEKWCAAVEIEFQKLDDVQAYLNADGKERRNTYWTLMNLASFCATASELADWIEDTEHMAEDDLEALNSRYARAPINRLKHIAANETA